MRIDDIPDSPGRTRNATRTAHHTSHLGAYPVPPVSALVCSLEDASDSSKSAPPNEPASSSFSSAARARSRLDMASSQSRPNIFPSFGSSSSETSQQGEGDLQLRKSCDYCVRMKRGCDGGTPCELCTRRNKLCMRSVKKRSGPAKGTKYSKRRARKKSSTLPRVGHSTDVDSTISVKRTSTRMSEPTGAQNGSGDEGRDDQGSGRGESPSRDAKALVMERPTRHSAIGKGAAQTASTGPSNTSRPMEPVKIEAMGERTTGLAATAGLEGSQPRWHNGGMAPNLGYGSLPLFYPPEEPVEDTSRVLGTRGGGGEGPGSQNTLRFIGARRGGLEQALYGSCGKRSSFSALLGSLDMDMDRNRKDSVGFPWNNRYSGDVVGQDGSRPAMGPRVGEVHAVPPQYAGAYVRTAGAPFVEARGPAPGAPHIILPTPSDVACEPSLKELLLEKWPPAPMSELTISETT